MTISQIKSKLSILTVLSHYGLEMNSNHMLKCPFHEDEKASMKVYPETNTVYCFGGSCQVSNLDVIDFIMQKEKCSKHEAIVKAKAMVSDQGQVAAVLPKVKPAPVAVDQAFKRYLKAFASHKKAQEYCEGRALEWKVLEVGYKSRKTEDRWSRGCIIFALKDQASQVVSLYGRSIFGAGHYYQAHRKGLYPAYPDPSCKVLLLTESIIDAATLLPLELGVEILALFGTNGLTSEHRLAIQALGELEEIILALDSDEAGQKASEQISKELSQIRLDVIVSSIELPQGEDVNSYAVLHSDRKGLFEQLLQNRKTTTQQKQKTKPQKQLNTSNPLDLGFTTALASYRIKGGLRLGDKDLDSLKVTLVVSHEGRRSRVKLDLYEDRQLIKTARQIGERLSLRPDLVELDLSYLTDLLENYRENLRQEEPGNEQAIKISQELKSKCLSFLQSDNLLEKINDKIGQAGLIGEETNRLLLFIVASSHAMPTTLHALIQGASGSGKTRLLQVISELMPAEKVKRYTRVTDGSFYNQGEYFFTGKLLCFEDIDGLKEDALLAVRELQSNEILITSTSYKDEQGSIRGAERIVRGPIASISCTTKAEVYEDNISRCFVVAVDESKAQSLRVVQYQNQKSAGIIQASREQDSQMFLQNCMRLLRPLKVVNPYANRIHLPQDAHKIRRLNELYQSFVRQITLLHQYQRKKDSQGRLISEVSDLKAACDILFESIVLKVDELDGSLRQFFEHLKVYVESKGKDYEFNRFEVRKATQVGRTQQHYYINKLVQLEYLTQYGFANRGYRYKIAYWDDMKALKQRIKMHLKDQLNSLST